MLARRSATIAGLAIALLAGPAFTLAYRLLSGENHSNLQVVARELGIFVLVGVLLWIVTRREMLPLTSIGLRTDRLGRSLLRGLVLAVVTLGVTVGLYLLLRQFGIRLGEGSGGDRFHLALWVVVLIMLRAGIAEEIFYRGYAIERLQSLTGSRWLAALVPLVVFAAAHYRQGLGGIIAAFVLGGIFTAFYVRYRDLLANITAHFLGDFVLNVVLPLLGG
jgi:membrane protease YdiL (CAAX protease family)